MVQLNCIVIDDEHAGRKAIEQYVSETDFLCLAGSFASPLKAYEYLEKSKADLLFLDIQMPKMNGIDFLKSLPEPPITIMITAYSEYAVQGFELDVVDYLLKPISKERFLKACNKALEFWELKNRRREGSSAADHFFIRCNSQYEKIMFDELFIVEAANNYVIIHTRDRKLNTYLTLKAAFDFLPPERFIKVHKSFIVAIDKVEKIEGGKLWIRDAEVPVSRGLRESVRRQVLSRNIIKR